VGDEKQTKGNDGRYFHSYLQFDLGFSFSIAFIRESKFNSYFFIYFFVLTQKVTKKVKATEKWLKFFVALQQKSLKPSCNKNN